MRERITGAQAKGADEADSAANVRRIEIVWGAVAFVCVAAAAVLVLKRPAVLKEFFKRRSSARRA
jgi:hypothetical protein